jgi:hypothetical protein
MSLVLDAKFEQDDTAASLVGNGWKVHPSESKYWKYSPAD